MALIKSKQIKDLAVDKVVTTTEKQFVSQTEKDSFADKYTKAESDATRATLTQQINDVQSSLSAQINNSIAGLTWKNPVATFADIATTYPTPAEGWMVTVDDTNKVYRYDSQTTSWVEFSVQGSTSYAKTILVTVAAIGDTKLNTGIRNDGTGLYKSSRSEITLAVNGFIQAPGSDKDYTTAFVANELVITWNNRHFQLETDDEVEVTYTHFEAV